MPFTKIPFWVTPGRLVTFYQSEHMRLDRFFLIKFNYLFFSLRRKKMVLIFALGWNLCDPHAHKHTHIYTNKCHGYFH